MASLDDFVKDRVNQEVARATEALLASRVSAPTRIAADVDDDALFRELVDEPGARKNTDVLLIKICKLDIAAAKINGSYKTWQNGMYQALGRVAIRTVDRGLQVWGETVGYGIRRDGRRGKIKEWFVARHPAPMRKTADWKKDRKHRDLARGP